ncbi:hypothetical protein BGW42_000926 [Actinomortierella wolfii]|nr:hypothetical protein BGW42_000926 [Actinomortierella wolfii]
MDEQQAATSSPGDITPSFVSLITTALPSLDQTSSNLQEHVEDQPLTELNPGASLPSLTLNVGSSAASMSTGTAMQTNTLRPQLSSPTLFREASISTLLSHAIDKRPSTDVLTPLSRKRTRLIVEEADAADDLSCWVDDGESDDTDTDNETLEVGMEGYERKLKKRDDKRFADWIVGKLNERDVFTALQSKNAGTKKKTPKAKIYRQIMLAFNNNPPDNIVSFKRVSELQVKNKIDNIKKAFRSAHSLRHSSGFGSQGDSGWKKRVKKKCRNYFNLENNWSKAWTEDVPLYADSLSNMDDTVITDISPQRSQKGKQPMYERLPEDSTNIDVDTTHNGDYLPEELSDWEYLETITDAIATTLPTPQLSRSEISGQSSSITPGRSRSTTPAFPRRTPAAVTRVSGHEDFGRLFIKGLDEERQSRLEKLELRREQFEFLKKDAEEKNKIELKKIELENQRLREKDELENQRLREQQKLDHEFRLTQLKLNAQLRIKGKEPVSEPRIQITPPPVSPPSHSKSP